MLLRVDEHEHPLRAVAVRARHPPPALCAFQHRRELVYAPLITAPALTLLVCGIAHHIPTVSTITEAMTAKLGRQLTW